MERELPALLEAVARSLRSGAALPTALQEAAVADTLAARDLTQVLRVADGGVPLVDALDGWVHDRPLPAVRLTVGALAVAVTSGGAAARSLDGVAASLRARHEVDREVRALATQARASAAVMAVAPVGFAVVGLVGDRRAATFLLGSPAGVACLVAGLVLEAVGAGWMARIARGPR